MSAAPPAASGKCDIAEAQQQPRECGLCHAKEPTPNAFSRCSQCKRAYYCSRECQKQDYYVGHSVCVLDHLRSKLAEGLLTKALVKQVRAAPAVAVRCMAHHTISNGTERPHYCDHTQAEPLKPQPVTRHGCLHVQMSVRCSGPHQLRPTGQATHGSICELHTQPSR